jgi:hypothetical protein
VWETPHDAGRRVVDVPSWIWGHLASNKWKLHDLSRHFRYCLALDANGLILLGGNSPGGFAK